MQAKVLAIFSVLFFGYLVNAYPFSQFFLNNARIITLDEECAVDQDTMFLTSYLNLWPSLVQTCYGAVQRQIGKISYAKLCVCVFIRSDCKR